MNELKVSSTSEPQKVAGAILAVLKKQDKAELHVIGAGASNQALKAIAIARNIALEVNSDLVCAPEFGSTVADGRDLSMLKLIITDKKLAFEVA